MDILAILGALIEAALEFPPGRVTVKERYEMKKRVRELKRREAKQKRRASVERRER